MLEAQTLARACGKSHLFNLEPEDLVALTVEAAAMAGVPLAGTDWIPGKTTLLKQAGEDERMATDLAAVAKKDGIKYFLISFVDLFGVLRAKLVPAAAIGDMAEGRRRLRRLRDLARHDAGRSRHVRDPRSGQPDPAALAARGRLARGRSVDGRQGGRERAAGRAQAPDRGRRRAGLPA